MSTQQLQMPRRKRYVRGQIAQYPCIERNSADAVQILKLEIRRTVLEPLHRVERARGMGVGTVEDHHLYH